MSDFTARMMRVICCHVASRKWEIHLSQFAMVEPKKWAIYFYSLNKSFLINMVPWIHTIRESGTLPKCAVFPSIQCIS